MSQAVTKDLSLAVTSLSSSKPLILSSDLVLDLDNNYLLDVGSPGIELLFLSAEHLSSNPWLSDHLQAQAVILVLMCPFLVLCYYY